MPMHGFPYGDKNVDHARGPPKSSSRQTCRRRTREGAGRPQETALKPQSTPNRDGRAACANHGLVWWRSRADFADAGRNAEDGGSIRRRRLRSIVAKVINLIRHENYGTQVVWNAGLCIWWTTCPTADRARTTKGAGKACCRAISICGCTRSGRAPELITAIMMRSRSLCRGSFLGTSIHDREWCRMAAGSRRYDSMAGSRR